MLICHQDQAAALLGGIAENQADFFSVVEECRRKLTGVRATLLCRKPRGEFKVFISFCCYSISIHSFSEGNSGFGRYTSVIGGL
jgi:hypothetical protein